MQTEHAMILTENLHSQFPEIKIISDYSQGSLKNQIRRADKSGAKLALIIGQEEANKQRVTLKYLRENRPQVTVIESELQQLLLQALVE